MTLAISNAIRIGTIAFFLFAGALAQANVPAITPERLQSAISERAPRVPEFAEIRRMAEERGLRVWLFGGTAAAFAHYVKWDLLREAGDKRFDPTRFDYDFTNIYRSTQDADLVVDGTPEQVGKFQLAVRNRFPYFMGSKDQWELRPLRHDMGEKKALLHNPDFLNQHTDSNSTGMIELTATDRPVVRDLRDWSSEFPQFLLDVAEGKLHYYFSDKHETTSRFLEGKNPPVISVVRYLTKAFQFELELRAEDLDHIRRIIHEFDPKFIHGGYLAGWLEGNGHKLFTHAVDVEYASNTLKALGLLEKLIAASQPQRIGSLGWWASKEPLRSFPVGTGKGQTVAQVAKARGIPIGEFVVAHETSDFLAYESLTRNTKNTPNVFISRAGAPGENAVHGDGHYTLIGRIGARGTGLTVRYRPEPNAREGTDFEMFDDMMVWKNRQALSVIQESLQMDVLEYFDKLAEGTLAGHADRGIREKFSRRMRQKLTAFDKETEARLIAEFERRLKIGKMYGGYAAEFMKLPLIAKNLHLLDGLSRLERIYVAETFGRGNGVQYSPKNGVVFLSVILGDIPGWRTNRHIVERLLSYKSELRQIEHALIRSIFKAPYWTKHMDVLQPLIDEGFHSVLFEHVFSLPHWGSRSQQIAQIIIKQLKSTDMNRSSHLHLHFLQWAMDLPHMQDHPEVLEEYIKLGHGKLLLMRGTLSLPQWKIHAERWKQYEHELVKIVRNELLHQHPTESVIKNWFKLDISRQHPELLEEVFGIPLTFKAHFDYLIRNRHKYWTNIYWEKRLPEDAVRPFFSETLTPEEERTTVETIRKELEKGDLIPWEALREWFHLPISTKYPEFLVELIEVLKTRNALTFYANGARGNTDLGWLIAQTLSLPHWRGNTEIVKQVVDLPPGSRKKLHKYLLDLFEHVFSHEDMARQPALLLHVLDSRRTYLLEREEKQYIEALEKLLQLSHWKDHAELKRLLGITTFDAESLRAFERRRLCERNLKGGA